MPKKSKSRRPPSSPKAKPQAISARITTHITVEQAAKKFGCTKQMVYKWCYSGRLVHVYFNGVVAIPADAPRPSPRPPGPPRGCPSPNKSGRAKPSKQQTNRPAGKLAALARAG